MARKLKTREERRERRHHRVRRRLSGSAERPRLSVFRSEKHMYAQIVNDDVGHTLVAASTLDPELRRRLERTTDARAAKEVGRLIAERARARGITRVAFDRGGYAYHGRVRAVAEGAREGGLEF